MADVWTIPPEAPQVLPCTWCGVRVRAMPGDGPGMLYERLYAHVLAHLVEVELEAGELRRTMEQLAGR